MGIKLSRVSKPGKAPNDNVKWCPSCKLWMSTSMFYPSPRPDKLSSHCRTHLAQFIMLQQYKAAKRKRLAKKQQEELENQEPPLF